MEAEMDEHPRYGKSEKDEMMTIETDINQRRSTAAMDSLILKFLRSVNPLSNLKLLKISGKTFLILLKILYLYMQKK